MKLYLKLEDDDYQTVEKTFNLDRKRIYNDYDQIIDEMVEELHKSKKPL